MIDYPILRRRIRAGKFRRELPNGVAPSKATSLMLGGRSTKWSGGFCGDGAERLYHLYVKELQESLRPPVDPRCRCTGSRL